MPVRICKESRIDGDLFNAPEEVKVVTINCVGAMGKGVAESAKAMYPELYTRYRALCKNNAQHLNYVWDWTSDNGKTIIMFPTKDHFKDPAIVDVIIDNISILKNLCVEKGYKSVACTGFGMGNGWLKPEQYCKIIDVFIKTFKDTDIDIKMYVKENVLYNFKRSLRHML